MTIILACNGDGTCKIAPLLIIQSEDYKDLPAALRTDDNIKHTEYGCLRYKEFDQWIAKFRLHIEENSPSDATTRFILTLNGRAPHKVGRNKQNLGSVPNVSVYYSPSNTTKLVQPMDTGIINRLQIKAQ
ncbi:hypothetical protein H4S07_002642 [Coemansia furcata]|uniref:Uncharacterized protein n=1 Tax=Coemansia furcata TaxID=417177 RepID=A0ACC1LK56_9FUNG|nr:hypothetical protein H4S07_002642 [Coemansia furcata]